MKALVTGATGFVGSRLVRRLVTEGHSVAIMARGGSRFGELDGLTDAIHVHTIDTTPVSVRRAVAAERPDVVFHIATYYAFEHKPEDLAPMLEANVHFPLRLVDAMAREGVSRLVNTGSAWQHFRDADYDPVCLHAATKQAFETLLTFFVNSDKIRYITLKLNDTYGPGDPRRKIFSLLREHESAGKALDMSAGEQLVDLVHIDDVTGAFLLAAKRLLDNQVTSNEDYVVSSGKPLPLRSIVETYQRLSGTNVQVNWGARPYRDREVMVPWQRGSLVPGWSARVPLEEGLKAL